MRALERKKVQSIEKVNEKGYINKQRSAGNS